MVEAPPDSAVDACAALSLSDADLARLVTSTDVRVEAYASSEDHIVHDQWVVLIDSLKLTHRDVGLNAALIGLTHRVGARVRQLLSGTSDERERLLPLLVKLDLAARDGSLGALLQRSTILGQVGTPSLVRLSAPRCSDATGGRAMHHLEGLR